LRWSISVRRSSRRPASPSSAPQDHAKAARELVNSRTLRLALSVALAAGNFLNHGAHPARRAPRPAPLAHVRRGRAAPPRTPPASPAACMHTRRLLSTPAHPSRPSPSPTAASLPLPPSPPPPAPAVPNNNPPPTKTHTHIPPGSRLGAAAGFRLKSLNKLADSRSGDGKSTLLQAVAREVCARLRAEDGKGEGSEVGLLVDELPHVVSSRLKSSLQEAGEGLGQVGGGKSGSCWGGR
jgi:hypothetical protein